MEFTTRRCMSLVDFGLLVCLRTSKNLSMGEFDKCKYAWVFLIIFGLKFGINLRFMHVFLRLYSVLALLSYDCRLA